MFHQFVVWLANSVGRWGYPGIVMLMVLVLGCAILVFLYWRGWKSRLPRAGQWEQ